MLGRVWLAIFHRRAVVGGGQDSFRRLTSEHVLGRLCCVARLGRLRAVRVVSGQRMGVLLRTVVLGEGARLEAGGMAQVCSVGGRGREVVVGAWGGRVLRLRLRLRGILPDHSHGGEPAGAQRSGWVSCGLRSVEGQRHSFTTSGWCLCLRGIGFDLLRLTCLAVRAKLLSTGCPRTGT